LITLRPYQEKAINDVRDMWRGGKRATIIVAPTGAGKTTVGVEIINGAVKKGSKIYWIVHRRELVRQACERLTTFGVDYGVIMRGHLREAWKPVQVCSVQTLLRRPHTNNPDIYFIDECHRALGDSYLKILAASPKARLIGLTATPWRTDGRGLGHLFDSIVECSSPAELTEQGFLVPARVFAPSAPDLEGLRKTAGDYNQKQLAERSDKATLIGDIVSHWKRLASGVRTVCFAVSIEHSKHIVQRFRDAGIPAEHLDGTTPQDDRDAILKRLESGQTRIVSNVGVWTEGIDIPSIGAVILARPTASSGLYLQMAGRALRPCEGKDEAIILDHAGCTMQHGFVTDDREFDIDGLTQRRKKGEAAERSVSVRICKSCYAAFPSTVNNCPGILQDGTICGQPYIVERQVEEAAGELEEVQRVYTIKKLSPNPVIARVQKVAEMMQYKPGWVYMQIQAINRGERPEIPARALAMEQLLREAV
jgi:DNA repair protein RadD